MFTDYSKYQIADFLNDDFFVDSMLEPSTESKAFWTRLIDAEKIEVDEFISAYMMLKGLHENKPEVLTERIDTIWEKISKTKNKKKQKNQRFKIFRYTAVACSIIGIIGFSLFNYLKKENVETQSIMDFARETTINTQQPNNQIQLISGTKTMELKGSHAKLEYDENGKLKVNQQSVLVNQTANSSNSEPIFSQLRVPYGKRAFLTLSDGSSLWLNSGTTVVYPTTFAKEKREIFVQGEVYAEVFHDEKRPFIIKTEKLDVQVLGTVFNVSAYKEDKHTDVVLVSGSVNVKPINGKSTIIKPNQMFEYTNQASTLRNVDVENYTSWHVGILVFRNEPIENILLSLSRYYNVTMKLPSESSGISCSGKLELKDELNQQLYGLSAITSLSYGVKDNEYTIKFR
jgi:transmembrane sensor